MAKTMATIFGLVLAAVSIGLNTARYPIVWQMAEPALASKTNDESPPVALPEQPATPVPPVATPEATDRFTKDDPQPEETAPTIEYDVSPTDDLPVTERPTAASPVMEEPLTPVYFAGLSGGGESGTVAHEAVRRLPPVVWSDPIPAGSWSNNGSIPVYPSTGIE